MQLILASASPRRQELLKLFGLPFTVRVADIDETMDPGLPPFDEVGRVSRAKALAIPRETDDILIDADTIVVCEGKTQVMTGCTLLRGENWETFTEVTDIHFRDLSENEIARYVASGEPMDKAGSYGIQGGAALFCTHMVGDYYNVMGLPVCRLGMVLRQMAPDLMEEIL